MTGWNRELAVVDTNPQEGGVMFLVHGTLLGLTDETINYKNRDTGQPDSFRRRQLHVLSGVDVHKLDVPEDFDHTSIPQKGSDVLVQCDVFVTKGYLNARARRFLAEDALLPA